MPKWLEWLITLAFRLLNIGPAAGKGDGRELGKAEANVENLTEQAKRAAVANAARRDADIRNSAGGLHDDDGHRRD